MDEVVELLAADLHRVVGDRDPASRRAAIEQVDTEDVVFTDPGEAVVGRDALEAEAAGLLASVPASFVFADDGQAYASAGFGALGGAFGPAGEPAAACAGPASGFLIQEPRPVLRRERPRGRRVGPGVPETGSRGRAGSRGSASGRTGAAAGPRPRMVSEGE